MTRREVVADNSSEDMNNTSSCSRGKTSRNQPTQPASASIAPRTLTGAPVRSPVNISVNPEARTRGHMVAAGISISPLSTMGSLDGSVAILSSAAKNVNHGKHHDPDRIDKMPVHRKHFHARRLLRPDAASQAKKEYDAKHYQTRGDVKTVQPDKRVVSGSKKVGRNGQSAFVDQPMPFLAGSEEKQTAQSNREEPQTKKCVPLPAFQEFRRYVDRQAARQKANGVENRGLKHFARCRPLETFPCVKQISHNENGKDRRLGSDQAGHPDAAAIRKTPCGGRRNDRSCSRAH